MLLGVLLIGYLMGHVWENFQERLNLVEEGFVSLKTDAIIVNGYSAKIVPLVPGILFFDPVNRDIVNTPSGSIFLYMKTSDGSDLSFNMSGREGINYKVVDEGFGYVDVVEPATLSISYGPTWVTNLYGAIDYFTNLSGEAIFMDVTFETPISDPVPDTTLLGQYADEPSGVRIFSDPAYTVAATNALYPTFTNESYDETNTFRRFYRVLDVNTTTFDVTNLPTGTTPSNFTFTSKVDKRYGVVHIPVPSSGISFVHVIDYLTKQHMDTYYFNSNTNEVASFNHATNIIDEDINKTTSNLSSIDGTGITPRTVNLTDTDFDVRTKYFKEENTIHVVGSKKESIGHTSFYTIISFGGNTEVIINYSSTKMGDATVGIAKSGSCKHNFSESESGSAPEFDTAPSADWSGSGSGSGPGSGPGGPGMEYSSIPNETGNPFSTYSGLYNPDESIQTTMNRIKLLKSLFGANNDYMLKTEVIPPICTSCGEGGCANCGGNVPVTTPPFTNGPMTPAMTPPAYTNAPAMNQHSNNAKDDFVAVVGEVKGDIVDIYGEVKSDVADVYGAGRDAVGDVVGEVKSDVAGVYGAGRDAVGDVYGAGRDAVGDVYGAGRDAVEGTVGLGKDFLGGVAGIFTKDEGSEAGATGTGAETGTTGGAVGGYQNAYGGLQPSTMGQDPYSYFGAVPARNQGESNFVPRLADFSNFGK